MEVFDIIINIIDWKEKFLIDLINLIDLISNF